MTRRRCDNLLFLGNLAKKADDYLAWYPPHTHPCWDALDAITSEQTQVKNGVFPAIIQVFPNESFVSIHFLESYNSNL